ncbi:MAG TPA: efflux RND transporter periplasmic adaptor subunit [Gemmatimonadaceae bacterium]
MTLHRTPRGALTLLALLSLAACGGADKSATAEKTPPTVEDSAGAIVLAAQDLATAQVAQLGASISLSGPLEPKDRVVVRAQVPGTVQSVRVDRGTAVRRGQLLATIRAEGVQSQAAGARAGVAAAQANVAVARQRLEAARTLRQAGAMSEIDFRSAQAAYESAEAQLAAARAQSAAAGEAAGYTTISAPIAGIVSDRKVDQGEAVNPGAELLTIVDARTLELRAQIGVADAARVRVGQAVSFTLDAAPGQHFSGRVARIDPTADPGTRQVNVYVELPNANGRIIGGQFARGSIATGATQAIVLPVSAVQGVSQDGRNGHVFLVATGRVTRRPVILGPRDEGTGRVAIASGIREGEQVIANPTSAISDGTAVRIAAPGRGQ